MIIKGTLFFYMTNVLSSEIPLPHAPFEHLYIHSLFSSDFTLAVWQFFCLSAKFK